jgi:hypothetical protein
MILVFQEMAVYRVYKFRAYAPARLVTVCEGCRWSAFRKTVAEQLLRSGAPAEWRPL